MITATTKTTSVVAEKQELQESLTFVLQADGFPVYMANTEVPVEVQAWKWIITRSEQRTVVSGENANPVFPEIEKVPQNLCPAAQVIWEVPVDFFAAACGLFSFYNREFSRIMGSLPAGTRVFVFLLR